MDNGKLPCGFNKYAALFIFPLSIFNYFTLLLSGLFAFEGLDLPIRFPVRLALLLRLGFMPEWLLAFIIFT